MQKANFNQVLEMAESLSESEQDFLIKILQKRLGEKRRKEIAASIAERLKLLEREPFNPNLWFKSDYKLDSALR